MIPLPIRNSSRQFRFEIPFVEGISKNRDRTLITLASGKRVPLKPSLIAKLQKAIAMLVEVKRGREPWPKQKTWIDVVVQKPSHREDATNCIDTLFDGIRDGLGTDDRWFAIGLLDWEIVAVSPNIYVQVSI